MNTRSQRLAQTETGCKQRKQVRHVATLRHAKKRVSLTEKFYFLFTEAILGIQTGSKFQAYDLSYCSMQLIYMRQQQILAGE